MQIEQMKTSKTGITLLVFGESGAGKTTLFGTLPANELLLLEAEGGTAPLEGKNIDCVKIREDLENLKDTFDSLVLPSTLKGYKHVGLDSSTELERFMQIRLASKSSNDGMPSLHDYGVVSFKMRDYMRRLRDLRDQGINVIVTALESPLELEQTDDTTRTRLYPMLARKLAPEVCGLFDVVAHMEISAKPGHEGERFLRLDGTEKIVAKNRWDRNHVMRFSVADLSVLFAKITELRAAIEEASNGNAPATPPVETTVAPTEASAPTVDKPATTKTSKKKGTANAVQS